MRNKNSWGKKDTTKNTNSNNTAPRDTLKAPKDGFNIHSPSKEKDQEDKKKRYKHIGIGVGGIAALWIAYTVTNSLYNTPKPVITKGYNEGLQWSEKNTDRIFIPKDSKGIPEHYELTNVSSTSIPIEEKFTLDDNTPDKIINSHCPHPLESGEYCSFDIMMLPRKKGGKWVQHLSNPKLNVKPLTIKGSYMTRDGSFKIEPPPISKLTTAVVPGPIAYATIINETTDDQPTQPTRFLDPHSPFGIVSNECPTVLAANDSCQISIRAIYRPSKGEEDDDQNQSQNKNRPQRNSDILQVGDTNVKITTLFNKTVLKINHFTNNGHIDMILRNNGNVPINTIDATVEGPGFSIEMNNCKPEVAPNKTCLITISAPFSGAAIFRVAGQKIELTGFGTDAEWVMPKIPNITKPTKIPFNTDPFDITLQNKGPGEIQNPHDNITLTGTDFTIKTNNCPKGAESVLKAGESCTITVIGTAKADGTLRGTISLRNGVHANFQSNATGFTPRFELSGDRLWTERGIVLFKNTGNFTIDHPMDLLTIYKTPPSAFNIDGCTDPVRPKEECGIILTRNDPSIPTARLDIIPKNRESGNIFSNFMAMGNPHINSNIDHTLIEIPNILNQDSDHVIIVSNDGQGIDTPTIELKSDNQDDNGHLVNIAENDCSSILYPGDSCTVHLHAHAGVPTNGENDVLIIHGKKNTKDIHITVKDMAKPAPAWVPGSLYVSDTGNVYGQINVMNHGRMPYELPDINKWLIDGPTTSDVHVDGVDCKDNIAHPGDICTYILKGNAAPGKDLEVTAINGNIHLKIHTLNQHYDPRSQKKK